MRISPGQRISLASRRVMLSFRHIQEASRNYNIMRPTSFYPKLLQQYPLRRKIATLDELKGALRTDIGLTVFRKLKPLGYLSSYSHRGSYYTLAQIARFDDKGLWSHKMVWFSRYGTLLATAESFVNSSPQGFFAADLADILH